MIYSRPGISEYYATTILISIEYFAWYPDTPGVGGVVGGTPGENKISFAGRGLPM